MHGAFRDLIAALSLDYLLIDTHPGLNEETLLSIAISDSLVIILRPDQQDFQGTSVTVDVPAACVCRKSAWWRTKCHRIMTLPI